MSEEDLAKKSSEEDLAKKSSDEPTNWYEHGYEERKAIIAETGERRNIALKEYLMLSKKYDQLKRNFYNLTETAVEENAISEEDGRFYKSEVKHVDKDVQAKSNAIRNSIHGDRNNGNKRQPFYKKR